MKALFIHERLEFERGLDPKASLSLGIEGRIKEIFEKTSGLTYGKADLGTILHYIVMSFRVDPEEKFKLAKYLIEVKKAPIQDGVIGVAIQNKVGDDLILYLITAGDKKSIDYVKARLRGSSRYDLLHQLRKNESANFERGLDPKDSLKIGIKNKRSFKTVHECAQFFLDNVKKLSEGRFESKEELKDAFNKMGKTEKKEGKYGRFSENPSLPPEKSPLRMSKDYLDGFIERDAKGETISHKYPPVYIEEWGTDFHHLLQKLQGLRDFHIELQKILGIHKESIIKEAANFERGLDPKEAIGVGQEELNKNRARDIGDIAKIEAGRYRIYKSGFFGRSQYRTVKDTGKTVYVSSQWAEKFPDGFEVFPKELEEMNQSYRKRNPTSGAYYFIDPEGRLGIEE